MAPGDLTPDENERLCVELLGYHDPITLYAWADRKQRANPIKAYKVGEGRKGPATWHLMGCILTGAYATEAGEKTYALGRYRLPLLNEILLACWPVVDALAAKGWRLTLQQSAPGDWRALFTNPSAEAYDAVRQGLQTGPHPLRWQVPRAIHHQETGYKEPVDAILRAAVGVLDYLKERAEEDDDAKRPRGAEDAQ
jgi:hypothetical protein